MTINLSKDFLSDLEYIFDFIAQDSLENAVKFKIDLYAEISKIPFMPKRFRKNLIINKDNFRDLIFKGYVVPFAIKEEFIEILGIYKNNLWKSNE